MFELEPGQSVDYVASGSWVRVDVGSRVLVMTDNGEKATLNVRDSVQFKPFSKITITNKSSVTETIAVRVSAGRIVAAGDENVVRISDAANTVVVENAAAIGEAVTFGGTINVGGVTVDNAIDLAVENTRLAEVPDVQVTNAQTVQLLAANANRREVIIQANAGDSLCKLRIGSATVAAGRGLVLLAGAGLQGSITLNTTAAIHVHNEGPDQVDVSITEINKVVA